MTGLRDRLRALVPEASDGDMQIARAPGRVNLIGEHTDYNDGLVLPMAINLETYICFLPTSDRRVSLTLADGTTAGIDLDNLPPPSGTWIDYVAGVAGELQALDIPIRGMRGVVGGALPVSAGLSSSAALELASAWALGGEHLLQLDPMQLALAAQRAENIYVGVACGLMDQFAVTFGGVNAALLLDCRSRLHRPVRLPLVDHAVVVLDSRSPRNLGTSEYNKRHAECQAIVSKAATGDPSITAIRDLDDDAVRRLIPSLTGTEIRRLRHVTSENARVVEAAEALERGEWATVGALFAASHHSLRDDYEVSSPALDALVEIANAAPGIKASRMTGAGFGGCTVNVVERERLDAFRDHVTSSYEGLTGRYPLLYVVEPAAGAGLVHG